MTKLEAEQARAAAVAKYDAIIYAAERLVEAKDRLLLVKKYAQSGKVWKPELRLRDGENYGYNRQITINFAVSTEMLTQAAIVEIIDAERKLIALGGTP